MKEKSMKELLELKENKTLTKLIDVDSEEEFFGIIKSIFEGLDEIVVSATICKPNASGYSIMEEYKCITYLRRSNGYNR